MKTYIIVPFRDEVTMTMTLIERLRTERFDECLLIDNDSAPENKMEIANYIMGDERFSITSHPGNGIYALWNKGWDYFNFWSKLEDVEEYNLVFLNNDITFPQGFIDYMAYALRFINSAGIVYPNYDMKASDYKPDQWLEFKSTRGTYKDGGMCGWSFCVRGEELGKNGIQLIDSNLGWWFGDDFMELQFRKAGWGVYRLLKLPVDHINEATSRNGSNEWTHAQKEKDVEYWNQHYG